MSSSASLPVTIRRVSKKTQKAKNLVSTFLVTINTNVAAKTTSLRHTIGAQLDTAIEGTFAPDNIGSVVKMLVPGVSWGPSVIDDVDIQYSLEEGNIQHRVHAHAIVTIRHHTKVQLNGGAISKAINARMDGLTTNPHVNIRFVPRGQAAFDYIGKGPMQQTL